MSNCIFCRIVAGDLPAKVVWQDAQVIAFHDIHPKAPVHLLVVPKVHVASLSEAKDPALLGTLMDRVRYIADDVMKLEAGYRVVINVREGGGQEVFHLHVHILGGKRLPF